MSTSMYIHIPMHNKYIVDDFPSPYFQNPLFWPSIFLYTYIYGSYMVRLGGAGGVVLADPRETRGYYSGKHGDRTQTGFSLCPLCK